MRSPQSLAIALAVVGVAMTGCLGESGPAGPDGPDVTTTWRYDDPLVAEHDHMSFEEHEVRSPTIERVRHLVLGDGTDKPFSYIGEMDTRNNLTIISVLGAGSTPGFALLDTTDPSDPVVLSRAEMPCSYVVDVKLSWDGTLAFAATQQTTTARTNCEPSPEAIADGRVAMKNGVAIWDISDPSAPTVVGFQPYEYRGCHMVAYAAFNGREFVWCVEQATLAFELERSPTPHLAPLGTYYPSGTQGPVFAITQNSSPLGVIGDLVAHDVTFQFDPLDGTPVLVVSHWGAGFAVLDVSDPVRPVELFRWEGEGATTWNGDAHGGMLAELDGRRILVLGPEATRDYVPYIWVWDVSDWTNPALVAEWSNPQKISSLGLLMTTHQIQLVEGLIYLTHNHHGLWVLDLAELIANGGNSEDDSEVLGVYLPHTPVALYDPESGGRLAGVPAVWDVNVKDGYAMVTDRYTGLHVVHFVGSALSPAHRSIS